MNPFDILKNLNIDDLKKQSQKISETLKDVEVTGEAGGGFVKVRMNGEFAIIDIQYENIDYIKEDLTTFKDLVISAHNDAVKKIKDEIKVKMSSTLIPGLF